MELLTHGGEHHEIGDGRWLMMTTASNPPLRSPERTPDQPSWEVLGMAAAPYRKTRWILLSDFFLPEHEYMELELRSVERQGAHEAGGAPPPSWTGGGPPDVDSSSSIFYMFKK